MDIKDLKINLCYEFIEDEYDDKLYRLILSKDKDKNNYINAYADGDVPVVYTEITDEHIIITDQATMTTRNGNLLDNGLVKNIIDAYNAEYTNTAELIIKLNISKNNNINHLILKENIIKFINLLQSIDIIMNNDRNHL